MTATHTTSHIVPDDDSVEILSDLVLRAALQADRLVLGKPADTDPIEKLVRELRETPIMADDKWGHGLLADPSRLSVIGRAMGEYSGTTLTTVSELSDKIRDLVSSLETQNENADPQSWRPFFDFCVALHRELMVRRGPIRRQDTVED